MHRTRRSGVICHPTSFPGSHGIGDLGEPAFRFVDWLARGAQADWQVLPLGPVGPGNSPYASPSAFAGNALLISIPWLIGDGLLEHDSLGSEPQVSSSETAYDVVRAIKLPLLREAYSRFRRGAAAELHSAFEAYRHEQVLWLDDFALFMALKDVYGGQTWSDWPAEIALRLPSAMASVRDAHRDEIRYHEFVQFLFDHQWGTLRRYANDRGISVIGDLPIFVAYDSADVWAHQSLFRLDQDGRPTEVAGVPPDVFAKTGQLWGNPVYNWERNAADGYHWWIARVRTTLHRVDLLRIDHFRGFAASWVVPAGAATAAAGHWEQGPGRAIFDEMEHSIGDLPFIVEDLGLITPDVTALREDLGLPGMSVLQFAFDSGPRNAYLPHNFTPNTVVYTGTHDNQTTIGWFRAVPDHVRSSVQRYLGRDGSDIAWDLIRIAWGSVADRAIAPLQDVMRLEDDARMNTPGQPTGNWVWRYAPYQLHEGLADGLREMSETYGRTEPDTSPRGYDPYDYTAPGSEHQLQARTQRTLDP